MIRFIIVLCLTLSSQANERIIALSPAINEIIFALGAGEQVVGNTTYSTYPEAAQKVAKVGGYFEPNLEKILLLNPTLVIMQDNNLKLAKQLNQLGIQTKVVDIDTIPHIRDSILVLGKLLHQETKAEAIINDIDTHLEALKNIVSDKKILIVIGHNTALVKQIFVAGQNLYFNDIIEASGNHNALQSTRTGQPILNQENIISTDPDIVILLAHAMKEKGLTTYDLIKPWKDLPIKVADTEQIYIIDKEYAGIPSDRLVLFLEDFQKILEQYKTALSKP
ncbi:MAG: ABC transporter substrate-binding protein [Campylobacterales bacterium]|nr:ABC transporter substrate-binding protein [Campylobacterales bacterium]